MSMKTKVLWREIERLSAENETLIKRNESLSEQVTEACVASTGLISTIRLANNLLVNKREEYQADWYNENRGRLDSQDAAYAFEEVITLIDRSLGSMDIAS